MAPDALRRDEPDIHPMATTAQAMNASTKIRRWTSRAVSASASTVVVACTAKLAIRQAEGRVPGRMRVHPGEQAEPVEAERAVGRIEE